MIERSAEHRTQGCVLHTAPQMQFSAIVTYVGIWAKLLEKIKTRRTQYGHHCLCRCPRRRLCRRRCCCRCRCRCHSITCRAMPPSAGVSYSAPNEGVLRIQHPQWSYCCLVAATGKRTVWSAASWIWLEGMSRKRVQLMPPSGRILRPILWMPLRSSRCSQWNDAWHQAFMQWRTCAIPTLHPSVQILRPIPWMPPHSSSNSQWNNAWRQASTQCCSCSGPTSRPGMPHSWLRSSSSSCAIPILTKPIRLNVLKNLWHPSWARSPRGRSWTLQCLPPNDALTHHVQRRSEARDPPPRPGPRTPPPTSPFCNIIIEEHPCHHGDEQLWPLPWSVAWECPNQAHRHHHHTMDADDRCTSFNLNGTHDRNFWTL